MDDTKQVTEDHVDGKEAGERDEEGEESKKRASKANKLWNWWRKMWTAPRDTQSRLQHEKEDDPRTGPKKDPDEAGKKHQEQEEEEDNPEEEEEGDGDLTEEVEKQFDQLMNTFNEARRTGDPLRYDREVSQGICDFKKTRGRCRELRNIDRYSVEKMEEKVKKETRIFSTSALQ